MSKITPEIQSKLIEAAAKVRSNAYAPYSKYQVGAALLLDDGSIEVGCNVENASYGVAMCAERVAIGASIAKGKSAIVAMAVVTSSKEPAAPCGACRQVMAEFGPKMVVIMANDKGVVREAGLEALLPLQFTKTF